jgi:hypothetical protein
MYYDCAPYNGTAILPVSGQRTTFTGSDAWLKALSYKDLFDDAVAYRRCGFRHLFLILRMVIAEANLRTNRPIRFGSCPNLGLLDTLRGEAKTKRPEKSLLSLFKYTPNLSVIECLQPD